MANLLDRFDAAHAGAPSPPPPPTPWARLPPKKPASISRKPTRAPPPTPIRPMDRPLLRDVTNDQDLGMITHSQTLPNKTTRLVTTLTTVHVRDGLVVRGRMGRRGLHGVQVSTVVP